MQNPILIPHVQIHQKKSVPWAQIESDAGKYRGRPRFTKSHFTSVTLALDSSFVALVSFARESALSRCGSVSSTDKQDPYSFVQSLVV